MILANYLAELWGFSLLIISLVMLIKPKQIDKLFKIADQEISLFIGGIVAIVLGIAQILAYNVWIQDWTVVITVLGWLTAIKGAVILLFPEKINRLYSKVKSKDAWISVALLVCVVLGCFLIYAGFTI